MVNSLLAPGRGGAAVEKFVIVPHPRMEPRFGPFYLVLSTSCLSLSMPRSTLWHVVTVMYIRPNPELGALATATLCADLKARIYRCRAVHFSFGIDSRARVKSP